MPAILDPNASQRFPGTAFTGLQNVTYDYKYPNKLKLKPGSDFHEELREKIWKRAFDSRRTMQTKYGEWREIDRTLKAYVPAEPDALTGDRRRENADDNDPMQRVILPATFATLETLLTYMSTAFLQDPIFPYEGTGPEDEYGAFLLTQHMAAQSRKAAFGLALHTQWRDSFAYGFGVVAPSWFKKYGSRPRVQQSGFFSELRNLFLATRRRKEVDENVVLWEGNQLSNIDPYRYFPDPGTSIHEPQKGEFVGWLDEDNYMNLRSREKDDDDFLFNVQYLRHISGMSSWSSIFHNGREDLQFSRYTTASNQPIDVLYMYINIIPREWKLGNSTYPEKWLFMLAADQVIIAAQPLGLYHNMFPVAVAAPDYDGYSTTPTSRLSITLDLQTIIDFLYSSHIANVRKAINDMLVVDPSLVNIHDINTPGPGKVIRMRRAAWGRGGVDAAIKQLAVADVTQGHVADASFLMDFMRQVQGTPENLQGGFPNRTSRISAREASETRLSGLARLERLARLISMQAMTPLSYMLASHTQQFADQERYVKVLGEWPERVARTYQAPGESRILVDPLDMLIDFDIKELDGTIPGSEDVDTWLRVFEIALQNPQITQVLDLPRIFMHLARQMGAKNVDDFIIRTNGRTPQVLPDEQVQQQAQAGNIVPVGGDGAAF